MLEKIDAVGEESDIKSDDEAAIGDDALWTEGASNYWVAEKGGVIENKSELRFVT